MSVERVPLPEGYSFVDKTSITPAEIIQLRESVNWDGRAAEDWQACLEQPLGVIVGVRAADNTLVGMGRLTADPFHVVLCDLAVNPNHRRQGIGKAIVLERVRLADVQKISYLYTSLAPDNPFRETCKELGFAATGGELFRTLPI